jgi:exosome complex component RRP42
LIAETDILPGTNGSARICFADGTEAIVGIKAEVEKSRSSYQAPEYQMTGGDDDDEEDEDTRRMEKETDQKKGLNEWVEMSVEIPGFRDDDSMPIFLAAMLSEALLADGEFTGRLWINRRFHWKLYLDVSHLHSGISCPLLMLYRFYCSRRHYHILCRCYLSPRILLYFLLDSQS